MSSTSSTGEKRKNKFARMHFPLSHAGLIYPELIVTYCVLGHMLTKLVTFTLPNPVAKSQPLVVG